MQTLRHDNERSVLREHLPLQLSQPRARLDSQLVEHRPGVAVGGQGLRLPARAVKRHHQLGSQALPVRLLRDQRLELADQVRVAAECEVGLDPLLQCGKALPVEPPGFQPGKRLSSKLGQRRPPPELESLAQELRGVVQVRSPRLRNQRLEAQEIELVRFDRNQIAGRPGQQDPLRQQLAQARDVHLQRRHGRLGRLIAPELVDQTLARDDPICAQQQERQHRPLLRAPQRERPITPLHLERAEQPVLHARSQRFRLHRHPQPGQRPPTCARCVARSRAAPATFPFCS